MKAWNRLFPLLLHGCAYVHSINYIHSSDSIPCRSPSRSWLFTRFYYCALIFSSFISIFPSQNAHLCALLFLWSFICGRPLLADWRMSLQKFSAHTAWNVSVTFSSFITLFNWFRYMRAVQKRLFYSFNDFELTKLSRECFPFHDELHSR